ncbi:hypothetical protein A8B78_12020 [Jannaschia sp. EhC01]|nr:hypothetical protein A8B78_12020 [Jannaschia sp. EhC01]
MFLRDLGISEAQFISGTHGSHKTQAIEAILTANPDLKFVLVGDIGQHDPQIYADIVARHPDRFMEVILRRPRILDLSAELKRELKRIEQSGTVLSIDYDYKARIAAFEAEA